MILEAGNIQKSYGNKLNKQEVLKGIDLQIHKGEFVSIMVRIRENDPFECAFLH